MSKTLWLTTTAVMTALLIGIQLVTASLSQFVTGSLVNLVLITSVMIYGLSSGLTIAFISPIAAKLLGIGPLWSIIPFIIAGNIVIVVVWHFIGKLKFSNKYVVRCATAVIGAVCKFIVLYVGIVVVAVPFLLNLLAPQAAVISSLFSFPQLFTALIGGGIAAAILPVLEKATQRRE